jgi:NitT/TauT family transport system substrate-binding protein
MQSRLAALALGLLFTLGVQSVPPARAQNFQTISVGGGFSEGQAQAYYAQDEGFFAKAGLTVKIQQLQSGSAIAAAVASGDLQFGVGNALPVAQAYARGIPFQIIAPGAFLYAAENKSQFLVVAQNSTIHTAQDLTGKIVAATSLGGLDQMVAETWIDKNGGQASSVKFIELPQPSMVAALTDGRISAAMMQDPALTAAGDRIRVLGNAYGSIANVYYQSVWFSTKDFVTKNPQLTRKFADAVAQAGAWAETHPEQAAAVLEKYTKLREPKTTLKFGRKLDASMVQPILESATRYKLVPSPVVARDLIWNGH